MAEAREGMEEHEADHWGDQGHKISPRNKYRARPCMRARSPTSPSPAGSSKDTLRPYVSFHAALRSAHQSFLARLDEQTRQLLRQHLDASTRCGGEGGGRAGGGQHVLQLVPQQPLPFPLPFHSLRTESSPFTNHTLPLLPPSKTVSLP